MIKRPEWWDYANRGIIGIGPDPHDWPTEGYDGHMHSSLWDESGEFRQSGQTREEWLALADEMICRWQAWRARIAALPDDPA